MDTFINTRLMSHWANWIRVPLLAFIGLAAIALVTGKLHNGNEKETENGE